MSNILSSPRPVTNCPRLPPPQSQAVSKAKFTHHLTHAHAEILIHMEYIYRHTRTHSTIGTFTKVSSILKLSRTAIQFIMANTQYNIMLSQGNVYTYTHTYCSLFSFSHRNTKAWAEPPTQWGAHVEDKLGWLKPYMIWIQLFCWGKKICYKRRRNVVTDKQIVTQYVRLFVCHSGKHCSKKCNQIKIMGVKHLNTYCLPSPHTHTNPRILEFFCPTDCSFLLHCL